MLGQLDVIQIYLETLKHFIALENGFSRNVSKKVCG